MKEGKFRVSMLQQEIEILTNKINHLDGLRWKTKQMAIVTWAAVVGFAVRDAVEPINGLLLIGALIPFLFWFVEASYHRSYKGLNKRFWIIRNFLLNKKWKLHDGTIATLAEFLGNNSDDTEKKIIFPVPEFWPKFSLSPGEWSISREKESKADQEREANPAPKEPTFWTSFWSTKIFLFYLPLSVISIILLIFGKKWF